MKTAPEHERSIDLASDDSAAFDALRTSASTLPDLPPDAMALIPLRHLVLFPGMIAPISLGRESSMAAAQEAVRRERPVGLILQHDADVDMPTPDQLYRTGTVATVLRYITAQDGGNYLVCQGEQRFRILEFLDGYPFHAARVQRLQDAEEHSAGIQARLIQLKERAAEIIGLLPQAPAELAGATENMDSASALADFVAGLMDLPLQQKQELLETLDLQQRIDKVLGLLASRIEVLRLSNEINEQTKERIDGRQREFLLREQMKTIQKELGETDSGNSELLDLRTAILRAGMPDEVKAHACKELVRLERMPEASAEYSMLCTYLEWMSELPWATTTEDHIDIAQARTILDEDHFGLQKVKRRILEYLAVRKLNPDGKSPILCFVGPPGVGKTSLGQSIARATGRKFARISLGGVHDEAEIRGHRRT
ncbi:MAG: LON peptidase substrate-binding domain-containing protein, partial [Noviherbaspirillum sp.]